ncbi:MAG TPA: DUF898 family protein, partial [Alphaproteobacteria bacterium]|nr:DUF898 family protein [Alphaproteobacteria bacterium]
MDHTDTPPPQTIAFRGPLAAFIGVVIINLLLTIVTLGIYRFWAKTRIRHFLWEHTSFAGEPLEYRGKGIELLVGAILGFLIIVIPYAMMLLVADLFIVTKHPAVAFVPTLLV